MRVVAFCLVSALCAAAQTPLPSAFWESPQVRGGEYVLWHDPGAVETLDFRYGIGGAELAPAPPFQFVEEDTSGSTAKVTVKDAKDRRWVVKFGEEASPDTFCTRLAWALGYYVEPNYFIEDGTIEGAHDLKRARGSIDGSGRFRAGRFQLRSADPKFLKYVNWSWTDNPFQGTPELGGLKILVMLVSDWDNKDARDAASRGSNTGIYQRGNLLYYFIDDWGGAMGRWGKYFTRSKWNADRFLQQSSDFVKWNGNGLRWGYNGQHPELVNDVKPGDIRWLLQYLGRVTDDQLRAGLGASGASPEQTEKYVRGLRMRIAALEAAAK